MMKKLISFISRWYTLIILLIVFGLSLFATRESFKDDYIAGWDSPAHLIRAKIFEKNLNVENLGIWSWYDGWYLGVAPFIFYTPGFFLVVSILKFISMNILTTQLSLKIVVTLSYALFPITLFWMCRKLGFSKRTSIFASIFSLTVSGIWGIGLQGLYSIGLYTHGFSLLLFMLFLGFFHQTMNNKKDQSFLISGLLLGFIILTNMITALYSLLAIVIYVIILYVHRKKIYIKKFFAILSIGFLISLFWLFPFLSSYSLWGPETGFSPFSLSELFLKFITGKILISPIVSVFMIIGIGFIVYESIKDKSPILTYIVTLFLFTLIVASNLITETIGSWNIDNVIYQFVIRGFRALLRTRSIVFLGIIAPILAAIGLDGCLNFLERLVPKANIKVISAITVLLLLYLCSLRQIELSSYVKTIKDDYEERYQVWNEAFNWLRKNAKKDSVVKVDINWNNFTYPGFIAVDSMVNLETGLRTLNGNQIEACSIDMSKIDNIRSLDDQTLEETLRKFGVDYILSYRMPKLKNRFFDKVYENKDITIYKVKNLSKKGYETLDFTIKPNRYFIKINVSNSQNITLPIQYNDHWFAEVNGRKTMVYRSKEGLISLDLKPGLNDIKLSFKRKGIETSIVIISAATFFLVISLILKNRISK